MYVCTYACMRVRMHVCARTYAYMNVCLCASVHVPSTPAAPRPMCAAPKTCRSEFSCTSGTMDGDSYDHTTSSSQNQGRSLALGSEEMEGLSALRAQTKLIPRRGVAAAKHAPLTLPTCMYEHADARAQTHMRPSKASTPEVSVGSLRAPGMRCRCARYKPARSEGACDGHRGCAFCVPADLRSPSITPASVCAPNSWGEHCCSLRPHATSVVSF